MLPAQLLHIRSLCKVCSAQWYCSTCTVGTRKYDCVLCILSSEVYCCHKGLFDPTGVLAGAAFPQHAQLDEVLTEAMKSTDLSCTNVANVWVPLAERLFVAYASGPFQDWLQAGARLATLHARLGYKSTQARQLHDLLGSWLAACIQQYLQVTYLDKHQSHTLCLPSLLLLLLLCLPLHRFKSASIESISNL